MQLDDHEFVDDLGDKPEHRDQSTPIPFIIEQGRQAYYR